MNFDERFVRDDLVRRGWHFPDDMGPDECAEWRLRASVQLAWAVEVARENNVWPIHTDDIENLLDEVGVVWRSPTAPIVVKE